MENNELELLLKPAPMSEAEKEFRAWIKECKAILADRNVYEVAEMAIMCGFDKGIVYRVLSTFKDAMDGTQIENRAAFQTWNFSRAVDEVQRMKEEMARPKKFDLMPLWRDLHANQTGVTL